MIKIIIEVSQEDAKELIRKWQEQREDVLAMSKELGIDVVDISEVKNEEDQHGRRSISLCADV